MKSLMLVALQFAALLGLAVAGPLLPSTPAGIVLLGAGVALGLWAIWAMRLSNLHIRPDVAASAMLTTRGPYRLIRHPMYAALLLVGLGWLVDAFTPWRLGFFAVLALDLLVKLHYEERLLNAQLEGYPAYRRTTYRLIPWVY